MANTLEDTKIRLATPDDADNIIEFLREHWIIRNHVFTRRRDLFDNCHLIEGRLTYLLAEGVETKKLYGILGYSFSNHNFDNPDISAVIFQTLKTSNPSLGIDMIQKLQELTNSRSLFCPGIIKKTKGIYDFLGYETGMLRHYYKLGKTDDFKIAHIESLPQKVQYPDVAYSIKRLETYDQVLDAFDFERFTEVMPYRDAWSVKQRYFDNIGYDYEVYGIFSDAGCEALFVGREIPCNGTAMFKVVDYLGEDEALAHAGAALDELLAARGWEYMDFYEHGIDDEYMEAAGFVQRVKKDVNIVPNYFEPYELSNVDIYYYTTWPGKYHIYRSDSGQDRPNFIEEIEE
ncbi:MAG: hypothetical protein Q4D34_05275 [Eggerthellaceae bacterium]|nr:hypothetical protein [Eggerthellaceae bacterium]